MPVKYLCGGVTVAIGGESVVELPSYFLDLELVDRADRPVAGARFRVTTPSGRSLEGRLDEKGCAHVDAGAPGVCMVSFPDLDAASWDRA